MLRIWFIMRNLSLLMKHWNQGIVLVEKELFLWSTQCPEHDAHIWWWNILKMKKKKKRVFIIKSPALYMLKLFGYFNSCVKWFIKGVFIVLHHETKFSDDRGHACFTLCCIWYLDPCLTLGCLLTRYTTMEGKDLRVWLTERLVMCGRWL